MIVRPPRADEAPRLAELSSQLGYPADPHAMGARLARVLPDPSHCVLVAIADDGRICGWIHAVEQNPLEYGPRCELLGLVVDRDHRRLGAGRTLVAASEQWARSRGLGEVSVRSNASRTESHPFYEQLGYERVKTQHVYRKPIR